MRRSINFIGKNFGCDFEESVRRRATDNIRRVLQVRAQSRHGGDCLGSKFRQGQCGFGVEPLGGVTQKRLQSWKDSIRFEIEFSKGVNGRADDGGTCIPQKRNQVRDGRPSVRAEVGNRPRGKSCRLCFGCLLIGKDEEQRREAPWPDIAQGECGSCPGVATAGLIQNFREIWYGGLCCPAKCGERKSSPPGEILFVDSTEPVQVISDYWKASYRLPQLRYWHGFFVAEPPDQQGKPIRSDMKDGFLCPTVSLGRIKVSTVSLEPLAQLSPMVTGFFPGESENKSGDRHQGKYRQREFWPRRHGGSVA